VGTGNTDDSCTGNHHFLILTQLLAELDTFTEGVSFLPEKFTTRREMS
jgi:hypothetical protein